MKRGQAAVMDALILMMICSAAATLLLYVGSLYGSNSNRQMIAIYNYEYSNTALLSLRYVLDGNTEPFWETLKVMLDSSDPHIHAVQIVRDYLQGPASNVFQTLTDASPGKLVLQFEGQSRVFYCHNPGFISCESGMPEAWPGALYFEENTFTTYAVSTTLKDMNGEDWLVTMKMFF